jgi:methylated-DNA-[protein]-cysteine S-methyltransferase
VIAVTRHTRIDSPVGELTIAAEGDTTSVVTGLWFSGHRHRPRVPPLGEPVDAASDPLLALVAQQLGEYFAGRRTSFDVPLQTRGDAFHEQVWALLRRIPHGSTTTYGALAAEVGDRRQAQRVGQAVGRNPIGILIPCHRVVGADGSLTGFAGGIDRKVFLLDLEESADTPAAKLF